MVVGFNHNFRYKDVVYHVQTEDGGINSPNITTLLYQGGTILASQKTSYADITKIDNLEKVVEELMKEQHKEMLRKLNNGDCDEAIQKFLNSNKAAEARKSELKRFSPEPKPATSTENSYFSPVEPLQAETPVAVESLAITEEPASRPESKSPPPFQPGKKEESSLDEVILSYLLGDDS